jgi:hypothetical protein
MRYEDVKDLKAGAFRRLTGVQPDTFNTMLRVLEEAEAHRKASQRYRGGKKARLTLADQLMMTLCYLREYRTQFHVGASYGLHETQCGRIIRHVEDTLMQSREFTLPGRKALMTSHTAYEVVVLDATETPIERPKKLVPA